MNGFKPVTLFAGIMYGSLVLSLGQNVLFDQTSTIYQSGLDRGINWQSQGGVPISDNPLDAGSNGTAPADPVPTIGQFRGAITYGAVTYQKRTNLNPDVSFEANAHNLDWPRTEKPDQSVGLVLRAQVGAGYMMRNISFLFGSTIPVPRTREDGTLLSVQEAASYWAPEPVSEDGHANTGYYWSQHANRVYAIQPGRIDVTWRRQQREASPPANPEEFALIGGNYFLKFSTNYTVSGAAFKTPRKIFWTEKSFQNIGKPVQVPTARVGAVNIVYQNEFPERVAEEFQSLGQSSITSNTNRLQELRTLWYDSSDGQIHAYNKQGRVFMEILGDVREGEDIRDQLGYEIVDVIRQATPADVTIELGEQLTPPESYAAAAEDLFPEPLLSEITKNFAFQHGEAGSDEFTLYATRETRNLNDYQVYWMEPSVAGLRWPSVLARYSLIWPAHAERYSHYIREQTDAAGALATAVQLPTDNVPIIEWQDRDGTGRQRAFLTEDLKFYTYLDPSFPAHRTLLRYTAGDNVAFERVFSWLGGGLRQESSLAGSIATTLDIWDADGSTVAPPASVRSTSPRLETAQVYVGQRLTPPDGEATQYSESLSLAGFIRQQAGTGFSVSAYKDPFQEGFEEAARGAIIPVNAGENNAKLEVWWYRKNNLDLGEGFKPSYWPSVIGQYNVLWPTTTPHSRDLILASNDGSGPLTSLEAKGSVYYQNDSELPGFNPNEEHALMVGGQAYALRDDLNIVTGPNYTSHPYVLVEYEDSDGRPSMSVFQVFREKGNVRFDYSVEAGTILQPPMPLPFLEKPLAPRKIGSPAKSLNTEIDQWPLLSSSQTLADNLAHVRLITRSRSVVKPYEPLYLQDTTSGLNTHWFYATNVVGQNRTIDGFVLNTAPHSLSEWPVGDQPVDTRRFRYGISRLGDLSIGDSVAVGKSVSSAHWIVSVVDLNTNGNGDYVEVEFNVDTRLAAAGADHLLKPMNNAPVQQFGASSWLAYQKLDESLGEFYRKFTFQDRKRDNWVYRGPHNPGEDGDNPLLVMKFYYKTLPGFHFPGAQTQPAPGTITPYLRAINEDGSYDGDAVFGDSEFDGVGDDNPLGIIYRPIWPAATPVLQMAETLTLPKRGLPAVRGQRTLEILYQQSQLQPGSGPADRSAVLHDPTREKIFELASTSGDARLERIPDSIKTSQFRGKTYFPNLPPHLSERFFFDPNRGNNGALVFQGQFVDEVLGDDYLLLNVVGQKDILDLKNLCLPTDPLRGKWDAVFDTGLTTVMEKFVENRAKPGTYIPSVNENLNVAPSELAEVRDDDVAVDSYALTAVGPGTGYVTLLGGNGFNVDVQPVEEPVQIQIIKVVDRLYRGELKIVQSSNPLAEKLTIQQVVDLAGKVDDFEFEWKITSPVDGQPPAVYQNTRQLLLGDGAWNHIHFPLKSDAPSAVGIESTNAGRRAADVNGGLRPISRLSFSDVSFNDGRWVFTIPNGVLPVPSNKVKVRYEDGFEVTGTVVHPVDAAVDGTIVVEPDVDQALPTGDSRIIELYEHQVAEIPQSIVFREFSVDNTKTYSQYYLSLDLDSALAAKVYINGSQVITANFDENNTNTTDVPSSFSPLSYVYRVAPGGFSGGKISGSGTTHQIEVELFSQALPDVFQSFNLRLEAYEAVDLASADNSPWLPLGEPQFVDKVRAIIGENADVRALSDNYLISRYRISNPLHASYRPDANGQKQGWSQWTDAQLAEGWIKRVLAGINPFGQRVTDLFNNRVNSDVSILTQAGGRWEGNVALNLDSINDAGLIEIYETVLRRGKSLSIGSGINFGPANDALLLAAGYLNDLYMMLGNEGWADAANPTIGIGTKDRTYGDIATALFAFKGQVPTLLDEELALLRGRDDFLVPGVTTAPVYNRLFWNYTRGIDSGEVIYALNYNIQEDNDGEIDGAVNAEDAQKMYPQGHGDAYGHYLTALKGYYALILDEDFDWVPRIEAVTILGKPVSVDYQDERKFAAAAAALARTGRQIFDLTWRKDYQSGLDKGWSSFSKERVNTTRSQPVPRKWGMDHWASRTMQGAYLNWALGNAILPDEDPDPSHEGIQKVDRTTVPELAELATLGDGLQTALDNAEAHMTPLGIPEGGLAFDVDPLQVTGQQSNTHFEQVYERATKALNNAVVAFDDAKDVTRLLRSEQDSLTDLQTSIDQQELAYTYELIELYGTPYADDIGPGRTYPQGYEGPDLIHYSYADLPETVFPELWSYTEGNEFSLEINDVPKTYQDVIFADSNSFQRGITNVVFNIGDHGFFGKPKKWTGRRTSPGKIQQAVSEIVRTHTKLRQVINDAVGARNDWIVSDNLFKAQVVTQNEMRSRERDLLIAEEVLEKVQLANTLFEVIQEATSDQVKAGQEAIIEALPRNFVAGLAAGGDLTSGARAGIETAGIVFETVRDTIQIARLGLVNALESATSSARRWSDYEYIGERELTMGYRADIIDLANQLGDSQAHLWTINETLRSHDDAWRQYRGLVAKGDRIQAEREIFRQRSAAIVQGFRTRDAAFRIFRDEKLERYKTLFDLAAQYAFLAANAYDYESGLLHTSRGKEFISRIVNSRALGVVNDQKPQFAGSNTGDPGLSSVLAEMNADFEVLKGRLGFNNPDGYGTTVSIRMEKERIIPSSDGDASWRDVLEKGRRDNLLEDNDVLRYCMQIDRGNGLPVPGIVLEFGTTIENGVNLFGHSLAGGDHYFDTSSFATKIFSVGVAFEGYVGMDNPVANSSVINASGGYSPPDPSTTFMGSRSLAATPGVYLIPAGVDSMRSPPLGDASQIRSWNVNDVAIPLPFNIGGSDLSTKALWQSSESLTEPLFAIRKHQAFRPVSTTAAFNSNIYGGFGNLKLSQFTNNRLIGRSVWNSKWKLVIPGHKLLGDPLEGLDRFIETVKDVKIHFVTYSYAGN